MYVTARRFDDLVSYLERRTKRGVGGWERERGGGGGRWKEKERERERERGSRGGLVREKGGRKSHALLDPVS